MNRRIAAVLVGAAIAAITIFGPRIGAHTAGAASGPPVAISGTVVDSTGAPESGVVVSLYPDRLDGAPSAALDSQVTDSSGTYSLATRLTADLAQIAAGHQQYVNFELEVESPKLMSSTFFSRRWSNGVWVQGEASPANGTVRLAPSAAGVAKTPRALARMLTTNGAQANSNPEVPCTTVDKRVPGTSQQRLTVIGELHTANDATETYTYGKSSFAESDISVATSVGGANWSLSGSVHMSDKNMGGTDVRKTAHENVGTRIGSYFQYAAFKRFKVCPTSRGTVTTFLRNELKPTNWNGGAEIGRNYDNHYLDGHCPPLPNRRTQSFTTDTEAHTLSEKQASSPMPRACRSSGSACHSKPRADGRRMSSRTGRSATRRHTTTSVGAPALIGRHREYSPDYNSDRERPSAPRGSRVDSLCRDRSIPDCLLEDRHRP